MEGGQAVNRWLFTMSIQQMVSHSFPSKEISNWAEKAEQTLKGKPIDSLSRTTYENIKLKPLYSSNDLKDINISEFPGLTDFRRGNDSLGYITNDWKVSQVIKAETETELVEKLLQVLDRGQTALSFEVKEEFLPNVLTLLKDQVEKYPFSLHSNHAQATMIEQLSQLPNSKNVSGYIGRDPISELVKQGSLTNSLEEEYNQWAKTIQFAEDHLPQLKTILVDTTPYHNGGANAVQELAVALATGVFHIEQLMSRGLSLTSILRKLVFKFAISSSFFVEIAKLRAARLLWSKIAEAYGASEADQKMIISAETSRFTKTEYDCYVNILRSGNEAFAAVLGGVQFLHVTTFDEILRVPSSLADRVARNTQLILKEEAHLTKVVDPAGGSWYVENLTNELSEKAWELFLEIEDQNGIYEALKTSWLQEQVAHVNKQRLTDAFTRKQSIIGTNIYANLDENSENDLSVKHDTIEGTEIQPIIASRLAAPYEELRHRAEKLGEKRTAGLICLGMLKDNKPRADFISGFLAPGGIHSHKSDELHSIDDAVAFVKETNFSHYFICGTNEQYEAFGPALVAEISKVRPNLHVFLAGLLTEQQEWVSSGVKQFVHVKSNCYETLSQIVSDMEVEN